MTKQLATIFGILVCVAACGGSSPPPPPPSPSIFAEPPPPRPAQAPSSNETAPKEAERGTTRAATAEERLAIERLARDAESVRLLRFASPITIEVEDSEAIAASMAAQVDPDEIERARMLYGALGLLDPEEDLEAMFSDVLGEQVIGYYDPKSERLVIRDDVISGLAARSGAEIEEARLVLVHELVHALQDQRLGLSDSYDLDRTADADNAFRAVVEGDAMLAMLGNTLRAQGIPLNAATQGIETLGSFIDPDAFVQGEELDDAPAIVKVTLVAPYLRGLQFIAKVHSIGGWPSVNRAHRRPPATSEQVLHPQKFLEGEPAEVFEVADVPALVDAGFERIAEDTLGELELAVYFGQGLPGGTDEAAATGWAGDDLAIYARGEQTVAIWWTTWDSADDAVRAHGAARRVSPPGKSSFTVRRGRAVLIVRDLPARFHAPARKSFEVFARGINASPPPPARAPNRAP